MLYSNTPPQLCVWQDAEYAKSLLKCVKVFACKHLGKEVSKVIISWNIGELNHACFNALANEMILNVDMLGSCMVDAVLGECDHWHVDSCMKVSLANINCIQIACMAACEMAMYSALVDDKVTTACFVKLHAMMPFLIRKAYPEMDLQSIGFAPQSVSMYPSSLKLL